MSDAPLTPTQYAVEALNTANKNVMFGVDANNKRPVLQAHRDQFDTSVRTGVAQAQVGQLAALLAIVEQLELISSRLQLLNTRLAELGRNRDVPGS